MAKTKTCFECKDDLPVTSFGERKRNGKTYLKSRCRPCWAAYIRRYRKDPKRMAAHRARDAKRQQELYEWHASLKTGPCVDCTRSFNPWQMDFDHLPGTDKDRAVSEMVRAGCSKERILEEIKKCELICACCHRDRTYQRRLAQE